LPAIHSPIYRERGKLANGEIVDRSPSGADRRTPDARLSAAIVAQPRGLARRARGCDERSICAATRIVSSGYISAMRIRLAFLGFALLGSGCGSDGDDTPADDDTTVAQSGTTAPADDSSSAGESTGPSFECDANVELAFADGIDLGAQSVSAVRLEVGDDAQYSVSIMGDAEGTTQVDIVYPGVPTVGMEYNATGLMVFGAPQVTITPEVGAVDLQSGTVTYTMVPTTAGEPLALELDLVFTQGTLAGCVRTDLVVMAG
jgi:hypothetical protein